MESPFKYIYQGKEVSKEEFTNVTKELFKWFDSNTINAVDYSSVSDFLDGEYKSKGEINNHLKGVLDGLDSQKWFTNKDKVKNVEKYKGYILNDNTNYPNQLFDIIEIMQAETEEELVEKLGWQTKRNKVLKYDSKENIGVKETENKVNYGELDWDYIDNMSLRMSKNLDKYPPKNWQKKMEIQELAKSAIRHARKILQEIDNDEETLQQHATALGCNGMMINYQLKNNLK